MGKSNTARKHHFVSQFYLRNFADHRGLLFVVDRKAQKSFYSKPEGIAAERDFNRIDIPGYPIDAVEKMFASLEVKFERALDDLISSESLQNDESLQATLEFMCLLLVRNPRMRSNMESLIVHTSEIVMDLALASKSRWEKQIELMKQHKSAEIPNVSYERVKDFHDRRQYVMSVKREYHIAQELKLLESAFRKISSRYWSLVSCDSRSFVTSDYPLSVFHQGRVMSSGIGLEGAEIFIPISPKLGLLGSFKPMPISIKADFFQIAELNARTILMSMRQVCAKDSTFRYMWGISLSSDIMSGKELECDEEFLKAGAH